MKLIIEDIAWNAIVEDLADEVVRIKMKAHMEDDADAYPHPEDKIYYKKLKKAARRIYKHYSVPD